MLLSSDHRSTWIALAVLSLALAACGASSSVVARPSPSLAEPGPRAACGGTSLPGAGVPGCLTGTVTIEGKPQGPAWVWVDDVVDRAPEGTRANVLMQGMTFLPRVLVVRAGTRVEFPNGDEVMHNAFSQTQGASFDLGLYRLGATDGRALLTPGIVKVFCNIHPHMAATVLVVPGRLVTETQDGKFSLGGVPPGKHRVAVWTLGAERPSITEVTVFPGDTAELELSVEALPEGHHRNKEGLPYGSYGD